MIFIAPLVATVVFGKSSDLYTPTSPFFPRSGSLADPSAFASRSSPSTTAAVEAHRSIRRHPGVAPAGALPDARGSE